MHVTADSIRAYLQLAPEAAEQQDSHGMTPFQYLCRNEITFLEEDRSFSSLMAFWYAGCMPPQTETTGTKRKCGKESVNYSSWTKDRLKELCREKGLFVSGSKGVLIKRIKKADNVPGSRRS